MTFTVKQALFFTLVALPLGSTACIGEPPPYYDSLTFIEPTIISDTFFGGDFRHYAYGFGHPGLDTWDREIREPYRSGDIPEKLKVEEWARYLESRGMRGSPEQVKAWVFGRDYGSYASSISRQEWDARSKVGYDKWTVAMSQDFQSKALAKISREALAGAPALPKDVAAYLAFSDQVQACLGSLHGLDDYYRDDEIAAAKERAAVATKSLAGLRKQAQSGAKTVGLDAYLQQGYAFHALRLADAAEDFNGVLALYRELVKDSPATNLTHFRAMGYAARAFLRLNQTKDAIDLYQKLYVNCRAMRPRVVMSLSALAPEEHWAYVKALPAGPAQADAAYTFTLAHETYDRSDILKLCLEQGPGRTSTEALLVHRIQRLEAESSRIGLVLVGEGELEAEAQANAEDMLAQCQLAILKPKIRHQAFWQATGGYLALLCGKRELAAKLLADATASGSKRMALQFQIQLWRDVMALGQKDSKLDGAMQARLKADVAWAKGQAGLENAYGLYQSLWVVLGMKALSLQDLPRAALYFATVSEHSDATFHLLDQVMTGAEMAASGDLLKEDSKSALDLDQVAQASWPDAWRPADRYILSARVAQALRSKNYLAAQALMKSEAPGPNCGGMKVRFRRGWRAAGTPKDVEEVSLCQYAKLMDDFDKRLAPPNKPDTKEYQQALFEWACILNSQAMTEPFRFRADERASVGPDFSIMSKVDANTDLGSYASAGFPLNVPSMGPLYLNRAKYYLKNVYSYNQIAQKALLSIAEHPADRELGAKALAVVGVVDGIYYSEYDENGEEVKADKSYERFAARMVKEYADTAFFKKYRTTCEVIKRIQGQGQN